MDIEICKKCLNSDNVKFKIYTPELDKDIEIISPSEKYAIELPTGTE